MTKPEVNALLKKFRAIAKNRGLVASFGVTRKTDHTLMVRTHLKIRTTHHDRYLDGHRRNALCILAMRTALNEIFAESGFQKMELHIKANMDNVDGAYFTVDEVDADTPATFSILFGIV